MNKNNNCVYVWAFYLLILFHFFFYCFLKLNKCANPLNVIHLPYSALRDRVV